MSSITISLYELDLCVEYDFFPEDGDNWESQYFPEEIDVTDVTIKDTDVSIMKLLTNDQLTEIEDEVLRSIKLINEHDFDIPDNDPLEY